MDSTILDSGGKPFQVDPPKETPETQQVLGKEAAKLFRALDNRKVPVVLFAFQNGKVIVRNNVKVKEGFDLKALLKEIIDRQL